MYSMTFTTGLVLVTLFGLAFGQIYQMRDDGIYQDNTLLFSNNFEQSSMCFNGQDIYYTNAAGEINILTIPGNVSSVIDSYTDSTVFLVGNVDCCCNVVAYGVYDNLNGVFNVYTKFTGQNITLFASVSNVVYGVVSVDCENLVLYVISRYQIDYFNLNTGAVINTTSTTLSANPRCATVFRDTNSGLYYIISTYGGSQSLQVTAAATGATASYTFFLTNPLEAICVKRDGINLYVFAFDDTFAHKMGYLISLDASTVVSTATDTAITVAESSTRHTFDLSTIRTEVTGIGLCVSCTDGCVGLDFADSLCIVRYPLAQRRSGPSTEVLGISSQAVTFNVGRLVKTGRWPVNALPNPRDVVSANNGAVSWEGFKAPVPSIARGRRFGAFFADINPDSSLYRSDKIVCFSTENSGFYNNFYTYTKSIGDSVTFVATFNARNQKYLRDLRWRYTPITPPVILVPECPDGQLTCTISVLTQSHEGVYEVYRVGRDKRTWHPIFHLLMRQCDSTHYGPNCDLKCPNSCGHGVCDDVNGKCICYSGWTGTTCDTDCPAGQIGQTCGISCNDIHAGNTGCQDLSICLPGKAGCSCYSGLQPPACVDPCATDTWGPNCRETCTACNARTGL